MVTHNTGINCEWGGTREHPRIVQFIINKEINMTFLEWMKENIDYSIKDDWDMTAKYSSVELDEYWQQYYNSGYYDEV